MRPQDRRRGGNEKSKFSESHIVAILMEGEAGTPVTEVCHKLGICAATWHGWKSMYAGVTASKLVRIGQLESENALLKRMYADPAQEAAAMNNVIAKKY